MSAANTNDFPEDLRAIGVGEGLRGYPAKHPLGYHTSQSRAPHLPEHYNVFSPDGLWVDRFRTRCCAEYAAHLLNSGLASVDPHAIVGCKVVAA